MSINEIEKIQMINLKNVEWYICKKKITIIHIIINFRIVISVIKLYDHCVN